MGGILKNPLSEQEIFTTESESVTEFRQKVLKNTQLNAQLTSKEGTELHGLFQTRNTVPKDTLSLKHDHDTEERLKWNQKNLEENEVTKQQYQDIHVDEPKTPYQGAIDPNGEYYREDDGEDLDNFTLGEPEYNVKQEEETELLSNSGDYNESEEYNEYKHRKFEEMRKKHYDVKDIFKNRHICKDEDSEASEN